jgi:DNA-binding beta-propeller fold protein YncE
MKRITQSLLGIISLVAIQAHAQTLTFENVPNFFDKLPGNEAQGPCHGGVVLDKAGNIYVTTDTKRGILVFSPEGKFQRAFGPSKIHALEMREEGGTEVIYAARPSAHEVIKIKLDGTQEWSLKYPAEANTAKDANGFNPCAVTVGPDGAVFVADGYGTNFVYKFDKDLKFVKTFGGPGVEEGKFKTCHGIALDTRGEKPLLFVCNRNNNRVEHWDLEGNFVKVIQKDLRQPAAVHIRGENAVIPELQGRVTVLDKAGAIAAQVGDNPEGKHRANYGLPEDKWVEGITNSPHGASLDKDGNLIVSEWSAFGRIHKYLRQK